MAKGLVCTMEFAWNNIALDIKQIELSALALVVCLAVGCTKPANPGNDSPAAKVRTPAEQLVGVWKTTASVPDSAGQYRVYSYAFTAEGLLLSAYPGMVDTSGYTTVGRSIKVYDPVTGKNEMNMGYEIVEGRLSLYNLDTEMRLYRVK